MERFIEKKNTYLEGHRKAKVSTAIKDVEKKITNLKIGHWLNLGEKDKRLVLERDANRLEEEALLDGCYVIKTDLSKELADKQTIHARYKDLALVEKAFRNCKTVSLEVRPVYVRSKDSTRGHVLVIMLAYKIIRKLREAWLKFDLTVEEGIKRLTTLCSIKVKGKDNTSCLKIPRPRKESGELLKALNIRMPIALPHRAKIDPNPT